MMLTRYAPTKAPWHSERNGIKINVNARQMPTNKTLVRKYWYCTKRILKKNINRDDEGLYKIFF